MASDVPFPLVDILNLDFDVSENDLRRIGDQILEGFNKTGYVYLKNHGLSDDNIESFVEATNKFFDLEEEKKIQYSRKSYINMHGYSTEKHEILDSNIGLQNKAMRNNFDIQGLHEKFPDKEVPQFRQTTKIILDKIPRIVNRILHCLEIGLKMKDGTLVNSHKLMTTGESFSNLKSVRYMPPEKDEQVVRFEPHYDFCTITLQLYADLDGLEILTQDGVWKKPKMHPDYILLFPSEFMQMWTGDQIKALMHRVVIPEDENIRKRQRHAVIFFIHPDYETIIKPIDGSEKYKPVTAREFVKGRLKSYFQDDLDET